MAIAEPERAIVRKALPLFVPALFLTLLVSGLLGGRDAAISAAIAVVIVFANFAIYGLSLAYAARISLIVLGAVALGGFVVRLAAIVVIIVVLKQLSWFSIVAFVAALAASTVALLSFEIRLLSGSMQADLWTFSPGTPKVGP